MPVRKIVPTNGSLTGRFTSWKTGIEINFESSLEKDFACLLEFDHHVQSYDVQPLTIRFRDKQNGLRRYTPDFLVRYSPTTANNIKPCLFEVKYRANLKKDWPELKPKFKAAIGYAKEHDYDFKIITEREIRIDRLFNSKFLLRYKKSDHDHLMEFRLGNELEKRELSTPKELVDAVSTNSFERGRYLYILWHMMYKNIILVDLDKRISMDSEIWRNNYS